MISIIRISLYEKKPKTLRVAFDFNRITLGKVKSIPGRRWINQEKIWTIPYNQIQNLLSQFDINDVILEEGVVQEYESIESYDFTEEINMFKISQFKPFATYVINKAPQHSLTNEFLIHHTIAVMKLADSLSVIYKLTDEEHDILLMAALMHDFYKFDEDNNLIFDHPIQVINIYGQILKDEYDNISTSIKYVYNKYWKDIASCIKSHEGQWNTSKDNTIIMPLPKTKLQKILHECDYISSRKFIEFK